MKTPGIIKILMVFSLSIALSSCEELEEVDCGDDRDIREVEFTKFIDFEILTDISCPNMPSEDVIFDESAYWLIRSKFELDNWFSNNTCSESANGTIDFDEYSLLLGLVYRGGSSSYY